MNSLFPNTLKFRLYYLGIWIILTVVQIFLVYYYLSNTGLETQTILYDSFICNFLQAVCIFSLWNPIKYFRNTLNLLLFFLFHSLIFLISSAIWLGLGFLFTSNLLPQFPDYPDFFLTLLPIRIFFGILIYVIFVLICYSLLNRRDNIHKHSNEEKEVAVAPVSVEKLSRVIVKKNSEFHCILVNQIRYIEANGDYVLIYTDTNKYLKDQTMKYWETHLPDDYFVRIHRSFIVNILVIAKIELYEKETYKVHLKNGDTLKASSAGYKLLKQKMQL